MSLFRFPGIPAYQEAFDDLNPILPDLARTMSQGWAEWTQMATQHPEMRHGLSDTTRAGFVYDKVVQCARTIFSERASVRILERSTNNPIFLLQVGDRYLIRFKKLDGFMLPSNVPTGNQVAIAHQQLIEGFEDLCMLTAGYQLNSYDTAISRMTISYIYRQTIIWSIPLEEPNDLAMFTPETISTGPVAPRVRPRQVESEEDISS